MITLVDAVRNESLPASSSSEWARSASRGPVWVPRPFPPRLVVCLCCGWLPLTDAPAEIARRHTRSTAHPTVYASGGS